MRRLAFAAIAALIALPAIGQWTRSHQSDTGTWVCAGPEGAEYDTLYDGAGAATIYCNGMAAAQRVIEAVLGVSVAEAALNLGQLQVCANGVLYVEDPTCASVGTGTDFAWTGTVPNFQGLTVNVDTIGPYDLSTHCTGTDCGSVTYSLETVSGSVCETGSSNFAIATASLSNDGTSTGSGSCRAVMSYMGDTVNGNTWSWDIGAAPGTDEIAPTIPTGITTTGSEGAVTIDWLASTDAGGDGVKDYLVKKDSTTIATVTSGVQSGLQLSYTSDEIGTVSGTPAYDVTGHSHSITCEGTGVDPSGSSDSICVQYTQLTGDFECQFTIDSITPSMGEVWHQGGMFFRESLDPNSRGYYVYGQYSEGEDQQLHIRERASAGGQTPAIVDTLLTFRSYLVRREGSTWTFAHKAAGSPDWEQVIQPTLAMSSQIYVGSFGSDNQGTGGSTVQMSQVACNDAPALSHTDSSGTGGSYTVAARDESDNTSADSVAVNGTPGAPVSGDGVKWDPGPYVLLPRGDSHSTIMGSRIPEICAMTNVRGMQTRPLWAELESSIGNYDFTQEREIYDALAACGKNFVMEVWVARFNNFCSGIVPSYLLTGTYEGGVTLTSNDDRCIAMVWKQSVMDRFIALTEAIAAEFEDEPFFGGIIITETAFGNFSGNVQHEPGVDESWTIGYSCSALVGQFERLIDASVAAFPTTNKILYANYINGCSISQIQGLMDYMNTNGLMIGGPDIYPQGIPSVGDNPGTIQARTTAQDIYIGNLGDGTDYRGVMPCGTAVQPPTMGARKGNHLPADLFAEGDGVLDCGYIFWTRKTWINGSYTHYGDPEANWNEGGAQAPNGLKAFINAGSANSTSPANQCPSNYSEGCQ